MARALLKSNVRMAAIAQVGGSRASLWAVVLPIATLGCARGASQGASDAAVLPDATDVDAGLDAATATADAPTDAGCAISAGPVIALDGVDDLAKYPASQLLVPGALLGADQAAVAWSATHLYVTMASNAFAAPYEPLHVYVETGGLLAMSTAAHGKEYSGLTPAVPFSPTHLVAVRRVSDAGTGAYDGVFVPSDQWMTRSIALDADTFASADQRTLSVRVPWSALGGCPTVMRLALHVVHGQSGNEWKDLVPATHTPWQMPGGGYYQVDLTGPQAVTGWSLH